MSDLVGRLRIYGAVYDAELADQAADEIERLQKAYRPADMIEYQELVAENERLQAWKDEHSRTEGGECPFCEIDRLRDALERLEAWVEQTNPDAYEKWKATQEALR
jgi:hypothetical protein